MRFGRFWKDDSGQALVIATVSLAVLMGFLALAVDVGVLFHARRNVQLAADSAAVAAALDYKYNGNVSNARTVGQAAAAANGISNTTTNVTVNIPPANGTFAIGANGGANYAEVLIQQPMTTIFTNFLGITNLHIAARAVAGPVPFNQTGEGCIWALAGSGSAVSDNGSGSIVASNCNIYDDSTASNALSLTSSGSITAKAIGVVGNYSKAGSGSITPSTPTTGISPAANPLNLTAPPIPTGTCSGTGCSVSNSGSSPKTVSPGNYTSISNSGSGNMTLTSGNYVINGDLTNSNSGSMILGAGNYTITGNFTTSGGGSVTLGAGLYIVEGNLSLQGSGSLNGSSVTFYIPNGGTTISASGSMNLTAPTSGSYNGVLIFQPSGNSSAISLSSSGSANLQGIVDAPSAPLTLKGSGSMSISTDLIVNSISLPPTASGTITNTNYAAVTNTNSVLNKIRMVE